MKKFKVAVIAIIVIAVLSSCNNKICPAYVDNNSKSTEQNV